MNWFDPNTAKFSWPVSDRINGVPLFFDISVLLLFFWSMLIRAGIKRMTSHQWTTSGDRKMAKTSSPMIHQFKMYVWMTFRTARPFKTSCYMSRNFVARNIALVCSPPSNLITTTKKTFIVLPQSLQKLRTFTSSTYCLTGWAWGTRNKRTLLKKDRRCLIQICTFKRLLLVGKV